MDQDEKTSTGNKPPINNSSRAGFSPGMTIAGRYKVIRQLGVGGMGQVYEVADEELRGQRIALKVLHETLAGDSDVFDRFRNEVYVARSLSHPHLVRIFDLGRASESLYYVTMEFVSGGSLKELIENSFGRAQGAPPPEASLDKITEILAQVLQGVAYAHKKGVIHRDLKPANILLSDLGEVKVADFGTARLLTSDVNLTQTGHVVGTPSYMAPEQIRGEMLDGRCDIFSLGIVAFEFASGQRPFAAENSMAAMFRQVSEDVPPLRSFRPDLPAWLEAWVLKATARDKEKRFQNADEMLAALEAREQSLPQSKTQEAPPSAAQPVSPSAGEQIPWFPLLLLIVLLVGGSFWIWKVRTEADSTNARPPAPIVAEVVATPALQTPAPATPVLVTSAPEVPSVAVPSPLTTPRTAPTPPELVPPPADNQPTSEATVPEVPTPIVPEATANTETWAREDEIYFFRSGEATPIRSFSREEISAIRWLFVLDVAGKAPPADSEMQLKIRHEESGVEEIFPARIIALPDTEGEGFRIGGNFRNLKSTSGLLRLTGKFLATVVLNGAVVGKAVFEVES